jgi:hypothetical protein
MLKPHSPIPDVIPNRFSGEESADLLKQKQIGKARVGERINPVNFMFRFPLPLLRIVISNPLSERRRERDLTMPEELRGRGRDD